MPSTLVTGKNTTVWKFGPLYPQANVLQMPKGAQILSANFQGAELYVWAIVDRFAENETRRIGVLPTGLDSLPLDGLTYSFIATTCGPHGTVWHVFEVV